MITVEALREKVVGRELDGGTWTPEHYEAFLAAECMLAPPPEPGGELHPMMVFHATVRAVAYTIEELFALLDCPMEDGPMLGGMDLTQDRPLRVGATYEVRPTITGVERKSGRSGTFDLVATRFDVREAGAADDDIAATLVNTYVCPRRG